ncbi:MAG: PTS transporter subunit EIIC [Erysipelotrichaceae bacterium]|nr:PTS transporter subunit EIIC [Erysipelotrichaceae bacterium]
MAKINFDEFAAKVVELVGGSDNLTFVTHCATRLRLNVKDDSKVDQEGLKKLNGVMGIEMKNGQCQVIVGQIIEDVYLAVSKAVGDSAKAGGTVPDDEGTMADKKNKNVLERFSEYLLMMSGILSPVIPGLIAAGFITCLLLVLQLLGLIDASSSTYIILNGVAQAVFYFMPIYVAYTSALKFDTEPVLAMILAGAMLYPDWVDLVNAGSATGYTSFFGIPTLLTTYNGSVLQIVLAVFVMSKLDKWLKKVIPVQVRHFLKPFLLLTIMAILTFTLLGPLGGLFTNYIYAFVTWVRAHVPWLAVTAIIVFSFTLGTFMPGFHMALIPIAFASLADVGYDDLINIWFYCCTITPGFLALAVALKTKKNKLKQYGFTSAISALFGGISEPTTYGIIYKMPQLYWVNAASAIITSIYAGIVHLKCYGFGGYSLTNILLYMGTVQDTGNFTKALIGVAIMAVVSFIGVFVTKWDDSSYTDDE